MKTIKRTMLFSMAVILMWSCKKNDQMKVENRDAPTLSTSVSSLELTRQKADETAIVFEWTKPDLGDSPYIINTLQFDLQDGDFSNPKGIPTDEDALKKGYTGAYFNLFLLTSLKLEPGVVANLKVRLKSQTDSSNDLPLYSEPINLAVTPYSLVSYTTSLNASKSALVLTEGNANETVIKFDWTMNAGSGDIVENTLQFDTPEGNFIDPKEVLMEEGLSERSYLGKAFNDILLSMKLPVDVQTSLRVRLKSKITPLDGEEEIVYSESVDIAVTPVFLTSYMYVLGSTVDSLISKEFNKYEGIVYFAENVDQVFEFKLAMDKAGNDAYGDGGQGKISVSGGNLSVIKAGSYQVKVNLNDLSIEMKPYQYTIRGNATTNSAGEVDLIYDNGKQFWTLTTNLKQGNIKFRFNYAWSENYGTDGTGALVKGAPDIPVPEAGEYYITFDLIAFTYSLTKK